MLTETAIEAIKPVRYSRKISDGGGLYLLVTPKGGRCWRYSYRYGQEYKKLSLGTYPEVTLEWARSRHEFARNLLANGVDPAALKAALGKRIFAATMREWGKAPGHVSELSLCGYERDRASPKAAVQSFKSVGVAPVSAKNPRGAVARMRSGRRRP